MITLASCINCHHASAATDEDFAGWLVCGLDPKRAILVEDEHLCGSFAVKVEERNQLNTTLGDRPIHKQGI